MELAWAYLAQMGAGDPAKASIVLPIFQRFYREKRDLIAPRFGSSAHLLPSGDAVASERGWGTNTRTVVVVLLSLAFRNSARFEEQQKTAIVNALLRLPTSAATLSSYVRNNVLAHVPADGWELDVYASAIESRSSVDTSRLLEQFVRNDSSTNCFVPDPREESTTSAATNQSGGSTAARSDALIQTSTAPRSSDTTSTTDRARSLGSGSAFVLFAIGGALVWWLYRR